MTFNFRYPNPRPSERGWGSGYPNCAEEAWVPLAAKNGVGFGRIHRGVHDLLELILNECIDRGYPPKTGQCWGSVCRCSHRSDGTCAEDASGKPVPSNHSWGLAIDFNSIDNPYGADRQNSKLGGEPALAWVPVLFREYGFRWLGPPIDDWQHFDFAGEPSDAVAMTAKARKELDDMGAVDDLMAGGRAFRAGKPLPANASEAFKYGYNDAERIKKAAGTPLPGTPAPHDHNDRYALRKHPHVVTE